MKLSDKNFKRIFWGILLGYACIMIIVTIIAYSRPYGGAGIDASQIVFIRQKASRSVVSRSVDR